jgi:hypothetical protein
VHVVDIERLSASLAALRTHLQNRQYIAAQAVSSSLAHRPPLPPLSSLGIVDRLSDEVLSLLLFCYCVLSLKAAIGFQVSEAKHAQKLFGHPLVFGDSYAECSRRWNLEVWLINKKKCTYLYSRHDQVS